RTFNPVSEDVHVAVRDDSQLFYLGRISAGSPNWSATAGRYRYTDPAGSNDGIVSIDLRGIGGLGGLFKATIGVRNANLGAAAPITAAPSTSGCAMRAFSSSTEEIHSPPDLMTSLARSVIWMKPLASTVPTSPVRSQPSWNLSSAASRWYAPVIHGPRTSISPADLPSQGRTRPASSTMRSSTPATTRP